MPALSSAARAATLQPGCAQAGNTVACTYAAGTNEFTVPAGVTTIHVLAVGQPGGGADGGAGGAGGTVDGDLSVTAGSTRYAVVASGGGAPGGGFGSSGGGGGASDVRTTADSLSSRVVVAAGGGGGSAFGGAGGAAGQPGTTGVLGGGGGGGSGTATDGGMGGSSGGQPGSRGIGGRGGDALIGGGGGGGGGGGHFGGGGGGGGQFAPGGGGGGGSSLVPPGGSFSLDTTGVPKVVITYSAVPLPTITFTSGPPPAASVGQAYSYQYTASGDSGITFAVSAGSPPAGLTLSPAGLLSGTPTAVGTSTFTVKATGDSGASASRSDTISATAAPAADLSITKSASPDPVLVGGSLVYTLGVANAGRSPATGVVVTDPLPSNVAYVSSAATQGGCAPSAGVVTCNLGTLSAGAGATVTITVRPTAKNLNTTNRATVRANEADPVQANNAASATSAVLLAEGSAFGVKLNALLVSLAPTPSVARTTPGTSSAFAVKVSAGTTLSAEGLTVKTQIGPGITVNSSAETLTASLVNSLVRANVVRATCSATFTTRTAATTLDRLVVAGVVRTNITPAPNTTVPLAVGSLVLNEQVVTADGITVNGLHLKVPSLGVDTVVSQARCVVDP